MTRGSRLSIWIQRSRALLAAIVAALSLSACSESSSSIPGVVEVSVEGDDNVTSGVSSEAFEDGWAVKYSWYAVSLSGFEIRDTRGSVAGEASDSWVVELASGKFYALASLPNIPAQSWDRVSFTVRPPGSGSAPLGVSATDAQQMASAGVSVLVDGTATKSGATKHFRWGFSRSTQYDWCEATVGGKRVQGVVVAPGGVEAIDLIVHGEHLFYDDLQSHHAVLRFDPIAAADGDGDGEITLDELAAVKLVEVAVGTYGTGSAVGVNTLGDFITAQAQSVVHYRGNGGCVSTTMDPSGR